MLFEKKKMEESLFERNVTGWYKQNGMQNIFEHIVKLSNFENYLGCTYALPQGC